MKTYGGVDVYIHVFLTSALAGGEWSASRLGRFTSAERAPGTHWIGDWVGPRASLDDVKRRKFLALPGRELRPLGRPARSQSLYRLCYPGSSPFGLYVKIYFGIRLSYIRRTWYFHWEYSHLPKRRGYLYAYQLQLRQWPMSSTYSRLFFQGYA
jgi:hypothetical protein